MRGKTPDLKEMSELYTGKMAAEIDFKKGGVSRTGRIFGGVRGQKQVTQDRREQKKKMRNQKEERNS